MNDNAEPRGDREPVDVVLVDDHEVVRSGIRFILDAHSWVNIVGEAGTGTDALRVIERTAPHAVFMDITLPDANGIELSRRIKRDHPDIKIIILTLHEDEEYFQQALQAGVSGFVVKGSSSGDLVRALDSVRNGGTYLDPKLATGLVSDFVDGRADVAFRDLTAREREVAELLIEGFSNQEIALKLNIGATTVQTHRSHIMEKLGLRNYGDLIRFAIREGVIQP